MTHSPASAKLPRVAERRSLIKTKLPSPLTTGAFVVLDPFFYVCVNPHQDEDEDGRRDKDNKDAGKIESSLLWRENVCYRIIQQTAQANANHGLNHKFFSFVADTGALPERAHRADISHGARDTADTPGIYEMFVRACIIWVLCALRKRKRKRAAHAKG